MKLLKTVLKITAGLLLTTSVAVANMAISNMLFFGDSLTDMGNTEKAPYTNEPGILWAHVLTEHYGLPLSKSGLNGEFGGNNWAQAGATSADVIPQIQTYLSQQPTINEDDVAFIWIGGNDIIDNIMDKWPDPIFTPDELANKAVANINISVNLLKQAGVKNIVIINMFALEITPAARLAEKRYGEDVIVFIKEAVNKFNTKLVTLEDDIVHHYDANAQLNIVLADHDAYGLKNVTNQAKLCKRRCNPNEYLFWDAIHPTNAAHKLVGDFIVQFLGQEFAAFPVMDKAA
jgi:outer membrane lipase/esterase